MIARIWGLHRASSPRKGKAVGPLYRHTDATSLREALFLMTFPMYRRLIKLYARAFYDGEILGSAQGEKPKKGKSSRGLAVVVLDTLMRRQWIKEEELAKDLQLHSKQVKKVVKILQDEGIVVRDSRKEVGFDSVIYDSTCSST